jgi:tetratricopeptide (TPR) repeat protein
MLYKTRCLAGLEPNSKLTDIPSARRNFFLLAQMDHQEIKMAALDNLILVLQNDPVTKETAFDLLDLAMDFMKQMDRELIQTQLIDEQIKICQAYGMVAELIQWHYGKKHIGGITAELKNQLIHSLNTLEDLNTHDDISLHFASSYALEGFKRLKDDRKELFELGEKVFHLIVGIAGVCISSNPSYVDEIALAFHDLDFQIAHSWYDAVLLFNDLAKGAYTDPNYLTALKLMIHQNSKEIKWKFLYNALEKLGDIVIKGSTPAIRCAAFKEQRISKKKLPGLVDFIDCQYFRTKTDHKPIIHFKRPIEKDRNVPIRLLTVQQLIRITKEAPDAEIRKEAKQALLYCFDNETNKVIVDTLKAEIPSDPADQNQWENELEKYAYEPSKSLYVPLESEAASDNPIQQLAFQILTQYQANLSNASHSTAPMEIKLKESSNPPTAKKKSLARASSQNKILAPANSRRKNSLVHRSSKQNSPASKKTEESLAGSAPPSKTKHLSDHKKSRGSKQAILLGKCLHMDPVIVEQYIEFNQDIHLSEHNTLYMTKAGIQKILQMIEEIDECNSLDFSQCHIQEEGLTVLIQNLPKLNLSALHMPKGLTQDAGQKLAKLFRNENNLKVSFSRPEDDLLFGKILVALKLTLDGIIYYNKGLDKLRDNNEDSIDLKARIYYHLADALMLEEEFHEAERVLLEAYKLDPENYKILSKLAKYYHKQQNDIQALKFAEKALTITQKDFLDIEREELVKILNRQSKKKQRLSQ